MKKAAKYLNVWVERILERRSISLAEIGILVIVIRCFAYQMQNGVDDVFVAHLSGHNHVGKLFKLSVVTQL